MSLESSIEEIVGDLTRFGGLADRVESLVSTQVMIYKPGTSDWIVLPWIDGFYLFSEDNEGQRRGREVLNAFLGPSVISIEKLQAEYLRSKMPTSSSGAGLVHASYLRRVRVHESSAEKVVRRLEDVVACFGGRTWSRLEITQTHGDMLRDFRLALLRADHESASSLLGKISLSGRLSSENIRYLRIELLAAFGRWTEMRQMPHISALLQSRRPRAISEVLLRMVWWTELVRPGYQSPVTIFASAGVIDAFGALIRSVRVPYSVEGRLVCFLAAMVEGDVERQELILDHAGDVHERDQLQALISDMEGAAAKTQSEHVLVSAATDPVVVAYEEGRFAEVIDSFLTDPRAEYAGLAMESLLDSGTTRHVDRVLGLVRDLCVRGELSLSRRARRDLAELERIADDVCVGWVAWTARLALDVRWIDASSIARDQAGSWESLDALPASDLGEITEALLSSVGGINDDQVVASLDLLCREAGTLMRGGVANDFGHVVLAILSEQQSFSEMVRLAYLDLFASWLNAGSTVANYREVAEQALNIWRRIASPRASDWAIGILEAAMDAPCPDTEIRTSLAVQLIDSMRQYYRRIGVRERVEIESLAGQLDIPSVEVEFLPEELTVWSKVDGALVGLYSLLPHAASALKVRLAQLCQPREVRGNCDKVATAALRSLAERADYLIVDTWHAAHSATAEIDRVRSRGRQILPRGRGVSGFTKALEEALEA